MLRKLVVVLAILLVPTALAQLPGFADVSISGPGEVVPVGASGSAVVRLTVANEGEVPITVDLTAAQVEPGWSVTLNSNRFQLEPGDSREVRMTLVPSNAATPGEAQFTIRADSTYQLPLVGQPVAGGSDEVSITAELAEMGTTPTDWVPWWLIAGIVALLLIAVLAMVSISRRGIRLHLEGRSHKVVAGTLAVVPVVIRNRGSEAVRVVLEVEADPEWDAAVFPDAVRVSSRDEAIVDLQITVPTEPGQRTRMVFTATPEDGRARRATVEFIAKAPE